MAVVTLDGAVLNPAMCRLCLQSGPETPTVSIFSIANGFVVAQMAHDCLRIEIAKDGSVYENVCSPCIVSLVSMYELYLKYHECNRVFLQLLQASLTPAAPSPLPMQLDDLIEEDYSIDEENIEIVGVDEPDIGSSDNGTVGQVFEDSVYYMQDFGVYVRSAEEMNGMPNGPSAEDPEWSTPVQQSTGTLMEELNAQVARLDGQEAAKTSPKQEIITSVVNMSDKPAVTVATVETLCGSQPQAQHQEGDQTFQEPKHHCFICETSFQNDIELVNHFPVHFLDVPQDCNLCGTHYRTVMNLNRHLAYHQPGRPYKCNLCERRFSDSQAFERHTAEFHHRAPQRPAVAIGADDTEQHLLVCDICGKLYVLAEPYEQHVRQHEHGQQQHQCKLCVRSFPRNIYLLFHLETHARLRPHRCRYCSIPFASLYLKNFHEKRHPPEGSDVSALTNGQGEVGIGAVASRRCPLCLTTCRTKQRLLAHIETFHPADTRIQLLQCSFRDCRLRFLDLDEFQSHISYHRVEDRFPCTHCVRVFKRHSLLATHLTTAHGIEGLAAPARSRCSFRCVSCAKNFRTERTYQLHLFTVHSQSDPGLNDS